MIIPTERLILKKADADAWKLVETKDVGETENGDNRDPVRRNNFSMAQRPSATTPKPAGEEEEFFIYDRNGRLKRL